MLAGDRESPVPMDLVIARELEILGSHGMAAHAYGPMFEMIRTGKLQPRLLVQKTIALDEAPAELAAMGEFRGLGVTVVDRF
jgi:alcohol dehydrogenase